MNKPGNTAPETGLPGRYRAVTARFASGPGIAGAAIRPERPAPCAAFWCIAFLFLAFCLASVLAVPQTCHAEEEDGEFSVRRAFGGLVRRDMAQRALRIAAESEAMNKASALLARETGDFFSSAFSGPQGRPGQDGDDGKTASTTVPFPLDGLADLIFKARMLSIEQEDSPLSMQVVARVRLEAPPDMRPALLEALSRYDLVEVHSWIIAERRRLLAAYDALADRLLSPDPGDKVAQGAQGARVAQVVMDEVHALQRVCNEIDAINILAGQLSRLDGQWSDPERARRDLAKAQQLAPENPLIHTALAEVLLQLDRPLAAQEQIGDAIKRAPGYARAHDVRGAILLRQQLPALAAESFGKAIALYPFNSAYLVHRASAYLVLGNEKGMCEDFMAACGMGDCEGLQWARGVNKCAGKKGGTAGEKK